MVVVARVHVVIVKVDVDEIGGLLGGGHACQRSRWKRTGSSVLSSSTSMSCVCLRFDMVQDIRLVAGTPSRFFRCLHNLATGGGSGDIHWHLKADPNTSGTQATTALTVPHDGHDDDDDHNNTRRRRG